MKDICNVHDYLLQNLIGLSIGGVVKSTRVKLVFISVLGDMEKQDELCCRFNGKDRANRRCNITHELLNDPFQQCKQVSKGHIIKHVQNLHTITNNQNCMIQCITEGRKESLQKLSYASTYPSVNPF